MRPEVMRFPALLLPVVLGCAPEPSSPSPRVETLYTFTPPTWFEDGWSYYRTSPDGRRALYGARFGLRLIDLEQGREDSAGVAARIATSSWASFNHRSELVWLGASGADTGWFARGSNGPSALPFPSDVLPRWSPDGNRIAWYRFGGNGLAVGSPEEPRRHQVSGVVTGLEWAPVGDLVYALVLEGDGASTLVRVRPGADSIEIVRRGLDAPPRYTGIGVTRSGEILYLALASPSAPDDAARHRPDADRDTDIYALHLGTDSLRAVVQEPGDDFHPQVIGQDDRLYWTHNELHDAVVVFPIEGGESRVVVDGVEIPYWHPDGRALAFTVGGWRIADWALNLDAAMVRLDSAATRVSEPEPIVVGHHEDFTPNWSPDGRWIVYHSHRSSNPVPGYASEGSTDDLYLRRPTAPMAEEIRLTDFGWEVGTADWAPDGRRLVFDSWERGKPPGAKPWIATIDPALGRSRSMKRLPLPAEVRATLFLSWSPRRDRDEIAFIAQGDGTRQSLWLTTPNGSEARKLLDFESVTYGGLDWTPDGERIVFSGLSGDRMQVFLIERAGGMARQLSTGTDSHLHPQVSPDGRWIAATRIRRRMELRRMAGSRF